jgi:CHRD domain-containing protein
MTRLALLLASAVLVPAALAAAQMTTYVANLDANQETPPIVSAGTGTGTFTVDTTNPTMPTVTYLVTCSGMTSMVNGGHLHGGTWGVAGGIAVVLTQTGPTTFSGTASITPAQVNTFANEGFYCNIHTVNNSGGEIRGQVILQSVLNARKGNVDTGGGGPAVDVLRINGSIGHPTYREMVITHGSAILTIATPPAGGNRLYAGWIFTGRSLGTTLNTSSLADGLGGTETIGTAVMCLPSQNTAVPNSCPCPAAPFAQGFTSKALGTAGAAQVCVHRLPADPRTPVMLTETFPVGTFTVCAVIFDPNAATTGNRKVSLTNAVTVVSQ